MGQGTETTVYLQPLPLLPVIRVPLRKDAPLLASRQVNKTKLGACSHYRSVFPVRIPRGRHTIISFAPANMVAILAVCVVGLTRVLITTPATANTLIVFVTEKGAIVLLIAVMFPSSRWRPCGACNGDRQLYNAVAARATGVHLRYRGSTNVSRGRLVRLARIILVLSGSHV